ncbi:MAG: class I SAM-dependent methyltransferase [Microcoleaceae cyanobacterium]
MVSVTGRDRTEEIQPAEAGFVCVDAVSTARSSAWLLYLAKYFAKFIAKYFDVKNKIVCEIGAGSGPTLAYLKKMGASKCVGVDYSKEAIEMANGSNKEWEFIYGDAFNLSNREDKQFDLVYSIGFWDHYSKEDQLKLISEQKRTAKECVFIEVPYDIFYFRLLFAINRKLCRTTTFSDEELFTKKTFGELGLKGNSKFMPGSLFLTIGHFEYLKNECF